MEKLFALLLLCLSSFNVDAFPKPYEVSDAVRDLGGVVQHMYVDCGRHGSHYLWVKKTDVKDFTENGINRVYKGVVDHKTVYFSLSLCTISVDHDQK
ncbi:hypothetical protein [Vibrio phage vB_VmeM-Yong XC32]|nr:hypothetical protein [Vibrio phage vB_VmeM-Yong XC31]QAX96518.1 hypothetical protein [Vibrio phage vB_VmeM-Yong XC32]QAX96836.1 hypothetical protein [Vibrio phage vB_VmeM-Yong MS31]